ncbi:hypothetical protein D3C87_22630 [compost metagenome]
MPDFLGCQNDKLLMNCNFLADKIRLLPFINMTEQIKNKKQGREIQSKPINCIIRIIELVIENNTEQTIHWNHILLYVSLFRLIRKFIFLYVLDENNLIKKKSAKRKKKTENREKIK